MVISIILGHTLLFVTMSYFRRVLLFESVPSHVYMCVMLQVKAEDADLLIAAPPSDNLIDFTDPAPAVTSSH